MQRRKFIAALSGVPLLGKLVPQQETCPEIKGPEVGGRAVAVRPSLEAACLNCGDWFDLDWWPGKCPHCGERFFDFPNLIDEHGYRIPMRYKTTEDGNVS